MKLVQASLLLVVAFVHCRISSAGHISERDFVTATDIRLECCRHNWACCSAYDFKGPPEDRTTIPPLPRSVKNPQCTLAKARREESQGLQCVVMFDILTAIHKEYHTVLKLEPCFSTNHVHKRTELIQKIGVTRSILELDAMRCCASHLNNHTARLNEIYNKAKNFSELKQNLSQIRVTCSEGHTVTIKKLFTGALHRLGQQLMALECLESRSGYKRSFCLDVCVREKSVQTCIDQWL